MTRSPLPFAPASRLFARLAAIAALSLVLPAAAEAQGKKGGRGPMKVPPGHMPSAGECRVWYEGRPPGQQPAPTDCATAESVAAQTGGRVIYGDGTRSARKGGAGDVHTDEGKVRRRGDKTLGLPIDPTSGDKDDKGVKGGSAKGSKDAKGSKVKGDGGKELQQDAKEGKNPKCDADARARGKC